MFHIKYRMIVTELGAMATMFLHITSQVINVEYSWKVFLLVSSQF